MAWLRLFVDCGGLAPDLGLGLQYKVVSKEEKV